MTDAWMYAASMKEREIRMNKRQKKKKETQKRILRQQESPIIRIARVLSQKRKTYITAKWR